ncbi:MAG: thioredoxin domain-containing protein, partial [Myxococcota bacterium]|nr:thioredoxin domain-containing protein [Myxococcota bacterium]
MRAPILLSTLFLSVLHLGCSPSIGGPTQGSEGNSVAPLTEGYRHASSQEQDGPWRNRLAEESSPYLVMHAQDPVDWRPWGDAAFEEARRRDVPVFLSIGYTACHWCHVMHEESFSDPRVAAFMNEHFVSIKVDREERPDVDAVYMDAIHILQGNGGWPASIWMTPERVPFYAGTYFPPTSGRGRPAFGDVLSRLSEVWTSDRSQLQRTSERVLANLSRRAAPAAGSLDAAEDASVRAVADLVNPWDEERPGWGRSRRFPMVSNLE